MDFKLYARQEELYRGNLTYEQYLDQCTLDNCTIEESEWGYRPSLPGNALFAALFGISAVLFFGQAMISRRFIGFAIAMVIGCILEVVGYVGRLMAYNNPFDPVRLP